jgi:hypothetical protein
MTQAEALIDGFDFDHLLADLGYAAQPFVELVLAQGMEPVIPPYQRTRPADTTAGCIGNGMMNWEMVRA